MAINTGEKLKQRLLDATIIRSGEAVFFVLSYKRYLVNKW